MEDLYMQLLYSDILPLKVRSGQQKFIDQFTESLKEADQLDIAVGYVSKASLRELGDLAERNNLQKIRLNMGMYYLEGIPESTYHAATALHTAWVDKNLGEVRMVRAFKYHGKLYIFYKEGKPFRMFIGSHNLGAVKLEANNRRQYELSVLIEDAEELQDSVSFFDDLWSEKCSMSITAIQDLNIIREKNTALSGIEEVSPLPPKSVELYEKHKTELSFSLPLKVPAFSERFMDDGKHYTKSNINVCYAAPRSKRKARDWYEIQVTVGADIYKMKGYPEKNHPFFVVTDDGFWFKGHTTSDNNKQFNAVGNELLVGRWLKGRLAAAGLTAPINNTLEDTDRQGMITKEILEAYGCNTLVFSKTDQKALDEDGSELDVWMLSFVASEEKGN